MACAYYYLSETMISLISVPSLPLFRLHRSGGIPPTISDNQLLRATNYLVKAQRAHNDDVIGRLTTIEQQQQQQLQAPSLVINNGPVFTGSNSGNVTFGVPIGSVAAGAAAGTGAVADPPLLGGVEASVRTPTRHTSAEDAAEVENLIATTVKETLREELKHWDEGTSVKLDKIFNEIKSKVSIQCVHTQHNDLSLVQFYLMSRDI